VTTTTVADILDIDRSTAYRAIDTLADDGVLEEVTGKQRNKEYRATEIFEILKRPPQTY
jgi:predicted transcriptional regulator